MSEINIDASLVRRGDAAIDHVHERHGFSPAARILLASRGCVPLEEALDIERVVTEMRARGERIR